MKNWVRNRCRNLAGLHAWFALAWRGRYLVALMGRENLIETFDRLKCLVIMEVCSVQHARAQEGSVWAVWWTSRRVLESWSFGSGVSDGISVGVWWRSSSDTEIQGIFIQGSI